MLKLRKKTKGFVAVCLICSIMLTSLCGVSFAFSNGSDTDLYTLFESLPSFNSEVPMNALSAISEHIVSTGSNVLAVCYYANQQDSQLTYVCEYGKLIVGTNNYIFCSTPGATVYLSSVSYFSYSDNGFGLSSDSALDVSTLTVDGVDYYRTDFALNNFMANNGIVYCSNDFVNNGNTVSFNLDISAYYPDMRFLEVVPQTIYDADYLSVTCDVDLYGHSSLLTVYYTDSLGNYSYGFQPYQYQSTIYDAPYTNFKVNVSSIPASGAFTITSVELSTATLWGTKSVSTSISYGASEIDLPSDASDITYFQTFVTSEHNSSIGATFIGTLYFGYYSDTNEFYIRDNLEYLVENFDVKFIALPNFLWNIGGSDTANWNLEEYYELFEMYDVVILGLGETAFDYIYGSGTYYTLQAGWNVGTWGVSAIINRIEKISPIYHSTFESLYESNPNDFVWTAYANDIGFIVTRNYLLKKVFYSLGDVDNRLLDFETKLLSADGSLASIQNKLGEGLVQDNEMYNKWIDFMQSTKAFYDKLLVDRWFENVLNRLDEIKSALLNSFEPLEDLGEPFLSVYQFFTGVLSDVVDLLPDFQNYAERAVNPDVPLFPTPVPTVPLIPTLGGGYDVVPY